MHWSAISHHGDAGASFGREEDMLNRVRADKPFIARMQKHMHPGMMMILTDLPLSADRRSGKDFVIVTTS